MADRSDGLRLEGRNGEVWRLYTVAGMTQEAIGDRLGIAQQRVSDMIKAVRASIPETDLAEARQRQVDTLAAVQKELHDLVVSEAAPAFDQRGGVLIDPTTGKVVRDHGTRLAAMRDLVRLTERNAKLLGLDAAVKVDMSVQEAARAAAAEAAAKATASLHGGDVDLDDAPPE